MGKLWAFLLLFLLSVGIMIRFQQSSHKTSNYNNKQKVSFETTLHTEPAITDTYQQIVGFLPNGEKVFVFTTLYPRFHYAETVRISGTLNKKVLDNEKTILSMYFPQIEAIKNDKSLTKNPVEILLAVTSVIRQNIVSFFTSSLPVPSSSLLLGIVFGIKTSMPQSFTHSLQEVGVMHVIAASGMNVAIVGGFFSSMFSFFLKRQVALICSIVGILFYAMLAGFEPSIVRASMMGILAFSAQILGRQYLAGYGLFVAGLLMILVAPVTLFDVGFQLSFLATFGLLYLRPLFEKSSKIASLLKKSLIGEELSTTIAAQLATLPVLLATFGTYSLWSIVVNALVLWVVPMLMVLGGIAAIVGLIFRPFGELLLYLALPFLLYFQFIVSFFAGKGGHLEFSRLPWQIAVGYYLLLLAVLLVFYKKHE